MVLSPPINDSQSPSKRDSFVEEEKLGFSSHKNMNFRLIKASPEMIDKDE